jgi:nitrate/nitrite transport system substrate-binding protein
MRRWGMINEEKPDSWYMDIAKKVYRPDVFMTAAKALIAEGKAKASDFPADGESGFKPTSSEFIDGIAYDGTKPNDYLSKFSIGLKGKQKVASGKIVD